MDPRLLDAARRAIGFMPEEEGLALYEAACIGGRSGVVVEIGTYCGKSTIYLGAAARVSGSVVYTIDHHRGSEEHQPGQQFHDTRLVDDAGRVDTLPAFRKTIDDAGLWDVVVGVVGESVAVARAWDQPIGLLFVDGGHSRETAHSDLDAWGNRIVPDGMLAIHDVFLDPRDGGRPPFEIYERALASGRFTEVGSRGSLRVLRATT